MNAGWYAVYTLPMSEEKAVFNLRRQGFSVYLPRYRKQSSHARKVKTVLSPFFPRYLFVKMDSKTVGWHSINSTIGVKNLVSFGNTPTKVPDEVIASLQEREDAEGTIPLGKTCSFQEGDRLELVSGPLRENVGIFSSALKDDERVVVLLNILGKETPVTVSMNSVVQCG